MRMCLPCFDKYICDLRRGVLKKAGKERLSELVTSGLADPLPPSLDQPS